MNTRDPNKPDVCDLDCQTCRRPLCTGACAILVKPRPAKRRRAKPSASPIFREYLKTVAHA